MRTLFFILSFFLTAVSIQAQSIRIHLKNGTSVSYTSDQVDYIDFIEQSTPGDLPGGEGGESGKHDTEPKFSETVEMMCLIFRLAGANEYNQCRVSSIAESADQYFASMTEHQAVKLARSYRQTGIAYDAVTGYGNQLIFDDEGHIIFDPDYLEGSNSSFDRWSNQQKTDMLAAINDFYNESKFHDWFVSTKSMQEKAILLFKGTCDLDYAWFDTFFGKNEKIASRIILSFLIGSGNNGISLKRADGTYLLTPTFGSFSESSGALRFDGDMGLVVHEFSHPYCNPLIEANWESMQDVASKLYSMVHTTMNSQAYSNALTMMCETFVRATTIRYLLNHYGSSQKESYIQAEENKAFMLVRSLVDALEQRETHQADYPTMDDFMPEFIKTVNAYPVDELIDKMADKEEEPDAEPETEESRSDKNLLTGAFSVSPTKKVKFTKGNLYWDGNEYHLEDDQLSVANTWDPNHVSHFYWVNDTDIEKDDPAYQPYAEHFTNSGLSYTDKFWCSKNRKITVDGTSGLHCLSGGGDGEWTYLLKHRNNADKLKRNMVNVNGIGLCLVIAPDGYTGTINSSYTAEEWTEAEKEGLVCLVGNGYRIGSGMFETDCGFYWSSTLLPFLTPFSYKLMFNENFFCLECDQSRNCGMLMRLVKTIAQ